MKAIIYACAGACAVVAAMLAVAGRVAGGDLGAADRARRAGL